MKLERSIILLALFMPAMIFSQQGSTWTSYPGPAGIIVKDMAENSTGDLFLQTDFYYHSFREWERDLEFRCAIRGH